MLFLKIVKLSKFVFFYCRYEFLGINVFNFVLENVLGGGGVILLCSDL